VHVQFLLGPAGSGKTFRCLEEIRTALADGAARPGGPPEPVEPLILLAPKQATFQLERQLLAGETIAGYTRLHVLSFERLAEFVLERFNVAPPRLLSAEGRLMVLRALLRQHDGELKLLRGSARRLGFAQELAGQLTELQQHQFGPARLRALAADESLRRELRDKLHDLALLAEKYAEWLQRHDLQDASFLLDLATGRLRAEFQSSTHASEKPTQPAGQSELDFGARTHPSSFVIQHLWLDGFAEMTPQEHALLAAVAPFCQEATLAFCLETEPTPAASWLSIWSAIGKTFQRCRDQLGALPGCRVETEILQRRPGQNRFPEGSALGALEAGWSLPVAAEFTSADLPSQISVTACATLEAEAMFAARELLKFVHRDGRNRFRDCAVLVRNLETYHRPVARIFRRYGIPFFLDRRESVSHHPLAELTRNALRTVAGDWRHDDWFAALKAGFTPLDDPELDRLENLALEFGWRGKSWREPLPDEYCERLRQRIFPPFDQFCRALQQHKFEPTGAELAGAIRELWRDLDIEPALEHWSLPEMDKLSPVTRQASVHQTVFDQMTAWLENVAMAFPSERLHLRDWMPVLDAGLAGLTVGVIPPALDEVLVGAIDRARNPDLKFTLLLGVNESVFPASPATPLILNNSDRDELDKQSAALGPNVLDQISRERYLGYIACTRASQRLALAYSRQDASGRTLNPSPFIGQLQKNLPQLASGEFAGAVDWHEAEHAMELVPEMVRPASNFQRLFEIPKVKSLAETLAQLREPDEAENLSPALAERIYGPVLKSSVSRLEEFAQCPFRFFVHSGLRAEERKKFELDARERGSFQHEILKRFHDELTRENKRWRDITPAEARKRIAQIAAALAPDYRAGLLRVDDQSRFMARALVLALQDFVATLVTWMRGQYDFDPAKAETGFGLDSPGLPAWNIDLGQGRTLALRGRVDRIDLCHAGGESLAVVMDYKSGARKLDKIFIEHGVQLQLLAYLAAVRRWPAEFFGAKKIVPAGVFYVNLRGQFESGSSRTEVLDDPDAARRLAYRHSGRFDAAFLDNLDRDHMRDQFHYQLNKDGTVRSNSAESLAGGEFAALLDQVEAQLRNIGERIFSGAAGVDPYRKGAATACDYCEYRAACRIDEWTHEFRELRAAEPGAEPASSR
jgi:ATP-dependent helicase/nuclease subunit B